MSKNLKPVLLGIGLAVVVIYSIGAGFWSSRGSAWYQTLKAPSWQPPDWVFGVIWPYNFVILTISVVVVAKKLSQPQIIAFVIFFALSVLFALLWSYLFYSLHELSAAAILLGLAAAMTFPILVIVWNASRTVGILLLPYQFWLVIAAVLSMGYAIKN